MKSGICRRRGRYPPFEAAAPVAAWPCEWPQRLCSPAAAHEDPAAATRGRRTAAVRNTTAHRRACAQREVPVLTDRGPPLRASPRSAALSSSTLSKHPTGAPFPARGCGRPIPMERPMTSYEESKQRTAGVLLGGTVLVRAAHRKVPLLCRPLRAAQAPSEQVCGAAHSEPLQRVKG
jgi:hypothetical protein